MDKKKRSFAFLVLAYNHEKYIAEHLESIKYLVETYGSEIDVDIIINDDFSSDKTVEIINFWISRNSNLFREVVTLFNEKNLGTCASVLNMLGRVKTDSLKLTAGDDVYSFENIFYFSELSDNVSILSGIPIGLIDGSLSVNRKDVLTIVASDVIYRDRPLIDRFKLLSNNNAPNIFYNKSYIMDDRVKQALSQFDVVEDWPLQIAIAENFPSTKFQLVNRTFVYYRRTQGSTYIVAGSRFFQDKEKIYRYLIDESKSWIETIFLKNRLFLFLLNNRFLNKILNASFYIYLFDLARKLRPVINEFGETSLDYERHQKHYWLIGSRAEEVMKRFVAP